MTAIATIDKFKGMLEQRGASLKTLLPPHISIDKFKAAAMTAAVTNPSILQCDASSVFMSLMKCAADGLVPDGREAAMVPFKGRAQYLPMVFGVIKMMRNSAEIASVWSNVVHEGEDLNVWIEDGELKFDHKYDALRRGGPVIGAYAVAKLKDGTIEFEPMGVDQIEKRRRASASQKGAASGVWADWYEEMARKTVIKALAKRLPISSDDLRRVQEIDEQEIVVDAPPAVTLEERLRAAQKPVEDVSVEPPSFDPTDVTPMDEEFCEGEAAFKAGQDETDNPYPDNPGFSSWLAGWQGARKAASDA